MNSQNKEILEKVMQKISISNFEEEEKIIMKKSKKNILKAVAVASLAVVSTSGVAFATNKIIKNFFGQNSSDGVDTAIDHGYVADIKTDYQSAEGIDIKIDSILMDDFNFAINFKIKLNNNYHIDEFEHIELEDLKVVDETGNIVFNTHIAEFETEEEMREKNYRGSYSFLAEKINDKECKVSLTATGNSEAFPKSKHLSVDFTKIKTWSYAEEEKTEKIYQGNWHFEIEVPEEFYNRESVIYQVKSCTEEGINTSHVVAILSNTAFKLYIPEINTDKVDYEALHSYDGVSIYNMMALQKEYIETSDGKKFETAQRSDGDGGYGVPEGENKIIEYHQTFNLTKYDATDELKVHIFTNKGDEIIIELEK